MTSLHLMSHELCPYVQRAVIVLLEKGVPFEKTYIDLLQKPDWFLKLSPLGKVPVLKVGEDVLFESVAICEYLDESVGSPLHPEDLLLKAKHRAWMEFSSALLGQLWGVWMAKDMTEFESKMIELKGRLQTLSEAVDQGPYFSGANFSMVDAFYGPVFRYFDALDAKHGEKVLDKFPRLQKWRSFVSDRPSVKSAVTADYVPKLIRYFAERESFLAS